MKGIIGRKLGMTQILDRETGEMTPVTVIEAGPGPRGASASPSRVFKGMKMAGRMGGKNVTQVGLTVVDRDSELNVLLVRGAVPGHKNSVVVVREDGRQ